MRTSTLLLTTTATPSLALSLLHTPATPEALSSLLSHTNSPHLLAGFSSASDPSYTALHALLSYTSINHSSTPFALIDCDVFSEKCAQHDIHVYPTLRLLSRDAESTTDQEMKMTRYRGPRTPHALSGFVLRHTIPVLSHVQPDELADFKQVDDVVFVAYLRPSDDDLLSTFRGVAAQNAGRYIFGVITDSETVDEADIEVPSVVAYKNIDGDHKSLRGEFSMEDVRVFVKIAGEEHVIQTFREREVERFMLRDKLTLYIFVAVWEQEKELRHILTPLAKKYAKYVTFAVTDALEYAPMAANFGLQVPAQEGQQGEEELWPAIVVHAPVNDNTFLYKQGSRVKADSVETMLTKILQAKAKTGEVFESEQGHDEL